ncbi:MAG: sodium:solute symporter [Bacteroidales bacterium]|jgi:Na+/proline symporter|nr:sodium:solute symporter [Bacteroidales bacterium]
MAAIILVCFVLYSAMLFGVTRITSRNATNDTYFRANRKAPWPVVAYGMIGASLSGVTFMSVPGYVQTSQFTYFGVVIGNLIGYIVIALVLLPLYYKLDLTSIYTYLQKRFGFWSHRTGSFFFIVSRMLGSALRMYLVVYVLYEFVFRSWGIPFWVPAVVFIALILLYTLKGGLRTIIWTDTLQTTFMLLATIFTIYFILRETDLSLFTLLKNASAEGYTKLIETNWRSDNFFLKQLVSGAFLTIAMNGLDQDMMQKNLSCRNLKEAQKNVFSLSFSLIFVNLLFLTLGAALLYYASHTGFALPEKSDSIFPAIAFDLSTITVVLFVIGLLAAGYSSADGTLTSLTTAICFDFFEFDRKKSAEGKIKFPVKSVIGILAFCLLLAVLLILDVLHDPVQQKIGSLLLFAAVFLFVFYVLSILTERDIPQKDQVKTRKIVHIICAVLFFCIIVIFRPFHDDSLIKMVFNIAALSYGPLLGLFCFGLFTKWQVNEHYVPFVAVAAPLICYVLKLYSAEWFNGYVFGFELLLLNGLLTFLGLCLCIRKRSE